MYPPKPLRGDLNVWEQAREVGKKKRQRIVFRKMGTNQKGLGRRSWRKEVSQ